MSLIVWILIIGLVEYLTGKCLGNSLAPFFAWLVNFLRSIFTRLP